MVFWEKKGSLRIFIVKVRKYQKIFFSCLQFLQKNQQKRFLNIPALVTKKCWFFEGIKKKNLMRFLDL